MNVNTNRNFKLYNSQNNINGPKSTNISQASSLASNDYSGNGLSALANYNKVSFGSRYWSDKKVVRVSERLGKDLQTVLESGKPLTLEVIQKYCKKYFPESKLKVKDLSELEAELPSQSEKVFETAAVCVPEFFEESSLNKATLYLKSNSLDIPFSVHEFCHAADAIKTNKNCHKIKKVLEERDILENLRNFFLGVQDLFILPLKKEELAEYFPDFSRLYSEKEELEAIYKFLISEAKSEELAYTSMLNFSDKDSAKTYETVINNHKLIQRIFENKLKNLE